MFAEEHSALNWFQKSLHLDETFWLYTLIADIRRREAYEHYYHYWKSADDSSHSRLIVVPEPPMMSMHRMVKEFLVARFERKPWSFGFMGGSAEAATRQHEHNRSFLRFDVRHAFFEVGHDAVVESLCRKPDMKTPGTVSKWVARFIADLCTLRSWPEVAERYSVASFLPQGSPTSPILFDIACYRLDEQLVKIANRTGGVYTRFADNVVVSMPDRKFPPKLRKAILQEAIRIYPIHKVGQSNYGQPFRTLGLQIADQRVRMTRGYKKSLWGSLYHLQYGADRNMLDDRAVNIARGRLGFAISSDFTHRMALASNRAEAILSGRM